MADMGLDAYRFSISWPRIYPSMYGNLGNISLFDLVVFEFHSIRSLILSQYLCAEGKGVVNQKGIEHYNLLIDCLLAKGTHL